MLLAWIIAVDSILKKVGHISRLWVIYLFNLFLLSIYCVQSSVQSTQEVDIMLPGFKENIIE